MARSRAPTFETQRQSILEAAAELFAQRGFAGASMASIATACGVSKPLLYHYYRDKDALLFGIMDAYLDRLLAITREVRASRLPPQDALGALISRFMQEYEHSQPKHRVLVQDLKFLGDAARDTVVAKEREVVDAFARTIAALKPRWTRRALRIPLAMILFGMINWTFTWLKARGPLTYGDMAQVVTDIFLHGVLSAADQTPEERAS